MARIRSTHPEQWTDDQFVVCSPLARLLALGIRNEADDNGVFEWNPVKLKMRILPADNCDVAVLLNELVSTNQIHRYEVGGKPYAIIRSFSKFQRPKEPKFYHPAPDSLPNGYELNKSYKPTDGEALPKSSGSGGEKSEQMEDGGVGVWVGVSETSGEAEPPASAEPRGDSSPTFITVPLVDKSEHPITEAQVAEWEEAYPAVDVRQQLRTLRQWNIANPTKRKTRKGILRHITDWLAREQDRGGKRHETHQPIDNSAPARVKRANERRERERERIAEETRYAERVD